MVPCLFIWGRVGGTRRSGVRLGTAACWGDTVQENRPCSPAGPARGRVDLPVPATSLLGRRREVAARYDKALAGLDGLQPLAEPAGCRSNIYKYIVLLPPDMDRALFKSQMAERYRVRLSGEVYDLPLHRQPVLAEYGGPPLPAAEDVAARHVCLPVHSDMTDSEVDQVLTAVTAVHGALSGR